MAQQDLTAIITLCELLLTVGEVLPVMIQNVVFWVVLPYNNDVGYQHFGGPCYLYHHPKDRGSKGL